jgi:putative inorganic carbon (hco3(-)) transporter
MHLEKIKSVYPSVLLILLLISGSLYTAHLIATQNYLIGPIVVATLGGILILGWMVRDYKMGIYFMFILSVFMSFANRMMGAQFQFGVVLDAIAALTFMIMLFSNRHQTDWSNLKHPITYFYVFIVMYQLLQVFNPNAVSFTGWLVAFRGNTSFLLFFAFYHLFQSFEEVKKFTILWIALAALVALYGLWQELAGLNSQELRWVYSNPGRTDLLVIWGHMRKFSLLSDPSIFGLFMAFSGLACFILALGPYPAMLRLILAGLGVLMMVSMTFSGTRTAFAMVAVGVIFYILITLKSRKTFLVMLFVGAGAVLLLFGPFYGGTVKRIRSTFAIDRDASMNVRDKKRVRLQEYVRTHPFGGGLNTTGINGVKYSAGHPLAEGWDPDSGYLLTALELGWIGLVLGMSFFFIVVLKGINNYFSINDPLLLNINLAYIVPFLSLSVAHFTQDAMFQKPVYLVIIATYALMLTLPTYSKSIKTIHKTL